MRSVQQQEVRVHIRWMIRRDMPEVLGIEREGFEFPWLEDDFVRVYGSVIASAWWPSMKTGSSAL